MYCQGIDLLVECDNFQLTIEIKKHVDLSFMFYIKRSGKRKACIYIILHTFEFIGVNLGRWSPKRDRTPPSITMIPVENMTLLKLILFHQNVDTSVLSYHFNVHQLNELG